MEFCYRLSFISQARLPLVHRIFTSRSFGRASPQALDRRQFLKSSTPVAASVLFLPPAWHEVPALRCSSALSVCLGRGDVERPTVGGGTSEPTRKTGRDQKTERQTLSDVQMFLLLSWKVFSSATVWLRFHPRLLGVRFSD